MAEAVAEPHELQRGRGVLQSLLLFEAGELQRQFDVFKRGQDRDQIEGLKHEADVFVAPVGDLPIGQGAQVLAEHHNLTVRSVVHRRDQVQQRRFARAGRPHQGDEFAVVDLDLDVFKSDDVKLIANEFLRQALRLDDCLHMCLDPLYEESEVRSQNENLPRRLVFILTPDSLSKSYEFFTRTRSPSLRLAGGLTTKSSPPIRPSRI